VAETTFDQACFDALVEDIGEDTAHSVIDVFFADTGQCLERLGRLDCEANRGAVTIQAHAIKSSSATFGFLQLSALARSLEAEAAALPSADIAARVGELQAALASARARFDDRGKAQP
jgi:histidine phosphotransfer protein HptB